MTSICFTCHAELPPVPHTGASGYGTDRDNNKHCYKCCADRERADMIATGHGMLYDCDDRLTGWAGTLTFPIGQRKTGRHNIAGRRYDLWFRGPDNRTWHGVRYGDNTQIVHCRRTAA